MKSVAEKIRQSLHKKESIVLGAHCSISYSGRAESFLPEGERIIVIKEDRALLVHQPTGNNPVNYMKPGTCITCTAANRQLMLDCANPSLKEHMKISIESVLFFASQKMNDGASIILEGNEKDFSDLLFKHPEKVEEGFTPLSREEHTRYGFVDIFGYDRNNTLLVVECKRFKAGPDAVTQLRRYVERIKKDKGVSKVRGMIVAPDITKNALAMVTEYGYLYKKFDPPKYHLKHKKKQKRLGEF